MEFESKARMPERGPLGESWSGMPVFAA